MSRNYFIREIFHYVLFLKEWDSILALPCKRNNEYDIE